MAVENAAVEPSTTGDPEVQTGTSPGSQQDDDDRQRACLLIGICMTIMAVVLLLLFLNFILDNNPTEAASTSGNDDTTPITYAAHRTTRGPRAATSPTGLSASLATGITGSAAPTQAPSTASTISTTTEDTFHFTVDYTRPIYGDIHNYACLFNASRQGLRAFGRSYGIAYFPYQWCHILLYCCYTLSTNMDFQPEDPTVDLPPRDAVRRAAGYKRINTWLWTYLIVRGPGANFEKLMDNQTGEIDTFRDKAVQWLIQNDYDGIRLWWSDTPPNRNESIFAFSKTIAAELYPHRRSIGFFVPYELHLRAAYDVHALQHALLVRHTIMLYRSSPLVLPSRIKWHQYRDVMFSLAPVNITVRNMLCHMISFKWLTYKLNDSSCDNTKIRTGAAAVVDWGIAGSITQTPGSLSRYEACDLLSDNSWIESRLGRISYGCKGDDVIVGLNTRDAGLWMKRDLHDPSNGICFGYMDPDQDDFPARCIANEYFPLMRAMFQYHLHGRPLSGGRLDPDLVLLTAQVIL